MSKNKLLVQALTSNGKKYIELNAENISTSTGKSIQEELDDSSSGGLSEEDLMSSSIIRDFVELVLPENETSGNSGIKSRLKYPVNITSSGTPLLRLNKAADMSDDTTRKLYLKKWCKGLTMRVSISDLYGVSYSYNSTVISRIKSIETYFFDSDFDFERDLTLENIKEKTGEDELFGMVIQFDTNFYASNNIPSLNSATLNYMCNTPLVYLVCFHKYISKTIPEDQHYYAPSLLPLEQFCFRWKFRESESFMLYPVISMFNRDYDLELISFEDGVYKDELNNYALTISSNQITSINKNPSEDTEYKDVFKLVPAKYKTKYRSYYMVLYSPTYKKIPKVIYTNQGEEDEDGTFIRDNDFKYPYAQVTYLNHGSLTIDTSTVPMPVLLNFTNKVPQDMADDFYFTFSPNRAGYCFLISANADEIYIGDLKTKMDAILAHGNDFPTTTSGLISYVSSLEDRVAQLESKLS